jgi:hypothetical protein
VVAIHVKGRPDRRRRITATGPTSPASLLAMTCGRATLIGDAAGYNDPIIASLLPALRDVRVLWGCCMQTKTERSRGRRAGNGYAFTATLFFNTVSLVRRRPRAALGASKWRDPPRLLRTVVAAVGARCRHETQFATRLHGTGARPTAK